MTAMPPASAEALGSAAIPHGLRPRLPQSAPLTPQGATASLTMPAAGGSPSSSVRSSVAEGPPSMYQPVVLSQRLVRQSPPATPTHGVMPSSPLSPPVTAQQLGITTPEARVAQTSVAAATAAPAVATPTGGVVPSSPRSPPAAAQQVIIAKPEAWAAQAGAAAATAAPAAVPTLQLQAETLGSAAFDAIDASHDGELAQAEFEAAFRQGSAGLPGRDVQVDSPAARLDASGLVSATQLEELTVQISQLAEAQQKHAKVLGGLPQLEAAICRRFDDQLHKVRQALTQGAQALKAELAELVMDKLATFEEQVDFLRTELRSSAQQQQEMHAKHKHLGDSLQQLQGPGGIESSIVSKMEKRVLELYGAPSKVDMRLEEQARAVQALATELKREEIFLKELRDLDICHKVSRAELTHEEQKNLRRDLLSLRGTVEALRAERHDGQVVQRDVLRPLRAEVEEMRGHVQALAKLETSHKLHVQEVAERLGQHDSTIDDLHKLHAKVAGQVSQHASGIPDLHKLHEEVAGRLAEHDSSIDDLRKLHAEVAGQVAEHSSSIPDLRRLHTEVAGRLVQHDSTIDGLRELQAEVAGQQAQHDSSIDNLRRLHAEGVERFAQHDLRVDDLRNQFVGTEVMQGHKEQMEQLAERHELHVQLVAQYMAEHTCSKEDLHKLQSATGELRGHAARLETLEERHKLHAQRTPSKEELHKLQGEMGELQGCLPKLTKLEQALEVQGKEASQQMVSRDQVAERLQEQLNHLQGLVKEIETAKMPIDMKVATERAEERVTNALEAEVTRRCQLIADLHTRLAREVAGVIGHVELRWGEISSRLDSEVSERKDSMAALAKKVGRV
uniref:EF-hand domain-containing protein n=1 Tax=Alexandrium monilatum TaxID=311494 RepID=A0A7S4T055_9DINO